MKNDNSISGSGEQKNGVNIYDISREARVSIATVSRVLNNSSKVSEKTRKKVMETMERLGYQPNAFARGLGLGSMDTIGIMVTDASDLYLASGVYHAEQALKRHGYSTILACSGYDLQGKEDSMRLLLSKRIDGVILIGSSFIEEKESDRSYILEAGKQVPVIITNGFMSGQNIYCVTNNEFEILFETTEDMMRRGRRNILYLYSARTYSGMQKLNGFRAALGAGGIRTPENYLLQTEKDPERAEEVLRRKYEEGIPIDGVIASDDICAAGAVRFALKQGLRIPEDLEIVGFNNSVLSKCTIPELSSIDNHVQRMSECAVQQMIRVLSHEEDVEQRRIIPCDFVKRGSSK